MFLICRALGITKIYSDYSVLFYGIGKGPIGTEDLGCCSQMAVFRLKPGTERKPKVQTCRNYKLVKEYEYPGDTRTVEEKIIAEVNASLYYERNSTEIPLETFLDRLKGLCDDVKTLR